MKHGRLVGKVCLFACLLFLAFSMVGWAKDADVIKIGAVLSVTGPNAPLGVPEKETVLMLADKLNKAGGIKGKKVELIIEDDGSDPSNAVKAAKKLIEQDKVIAIIGSSGTGPTLAMVPIIERAKVPHISCAAGIAITQPLKKWVFRSPQTDIIAVSKILRRLKAEKVKKLAVLYDSNPFGTSGKEQLEIQASKFGIKIVAQESFGSKDTDMTVQLTKIKGSDAQALIVWGTNPGPAIIAKNAKQLKIGLPIYNSHGVANRKFIELGGEAVEGIIFPTGKLLVADSLPNSDLQKSVLVKYAKDFKAEYKKEPDTFGGHAWDAFQIIVNAIKKAGTNKEKIRNEIEKTQKFVGIAGVFNYSATDHDGLDEDAFVLVKIQKGDWVVVK